jgi:hypothetical protein
MQGYGGMHVYYIFRHSPEDRYREIMKNLKILLNITKALNGLHNGKIKGRK